GGGGGGGGQTGRRRPLTPVGPGPRRPGTQYFSRHYFSASQADRLAVAARVGAAREPAGRRIDGDAVGMAGVLVPVGPAVEQMPTALELVDGLAREARLDMQRVARLADGETAGQEARHVERLLDVEAVVDQGVVDLQMDLRLAVGAHATQHGPQFVVPESERGDQRVQRRLARLDTVGALG